MSTWRCFCSKLGNFGTIFAATRFMPKTSVKMAWHEPNDMRTSSATSLIVSDSMIIQNHFLHCFNVFICCWRARTIKTIIVIDIFSAFLKPLIPQLNLCSAHSRLSKRLCLFVYFFFFWFFFVISVTKTRTVNFDEWFKSLESFMNTKVAFYISRFGNTSVTICQLTALL